MKNGELENGANVYLDILKAMGLNAEIIPNDLLAQSYSNIENEEEFLKTECCSGKTNCNCDSSCCNKVEESIKIEDKSDKVYLFTSSGESDDSMQIAEMKAKTRANILGLKRTRVEVIDLTGKTIVNSTNSYKFPEVVYGSYRMNYIDYTKDYNDNYDFISAGCGILELVDIETKDSALPLKIGIVLMAYSYNDDLEQLARYITDGLMEVYASGHNDKYEIVNFHTAVEGFNPKKENAIVIAGILD